MSENFSDNSLPKELILRSRHEIKQIFETGTFKKLKFVTLVYIKTELQKAGFFVTKKHGNAVKRNRVKRWLREIYRLNKPLFDGYSIVFLVNRPVEFSYQELADDILSRDLKL